MNRQTWLLLCTAVVIVNLTGLTCDIFLPDSSLYAMISKSLHVSGDYLNIYVAGKDWLDKPHFPFWVCALSIKLFGINTWAYKLPSVLFFFAGLFYTYQLACRLYSKEVGRWTVLILGSSFHIIISNNDVRAEAILLGTIMGAVYHMCSLAHASSKRDMLFASLWSAAAIMTKGIFVLIIIYSAIFLDIMVKKDYKKLLALRWVVVFGLTLMLLTPELYAVYQQFDLHPEKIVFGQKGVSGIKFFLWDSQFGRFLNNAPIQGSGYIFFYGHTILWAFAPWAAIGGVSWAYKASRLLKGIKTDEYLTFFGFSVMFLVFSMSKFQLPHYINIVLPFLSVMVASSLTRYDKNKIFRKTMRLSSNVYAIVFVLLIASMAYFFRPDYPIIELGFLFSFVVLIVIINFYARQLKCRYAIYGTLLGIMFGLYLNLGFYPTLLKYQSGSQAAFYINQNYPNDNILVTHRDWLLTYYAKNDLIFVEGIEALKSHLKDKDELLLTSANFFSKLKSRKFKYTIIKTFENFHVTILNKDFIYYKTREKATETFYLIKLNAI